MAINLVVPLVLAIILGILFAPLVDLMEKRRIPRAAGAGITMLLILVIAGGTIWLVESSVAGQVGTIQQQLNSARRRAADVVRLARLPAGFINEVTANIKAQLPKVGQSVANALLAGITGVATFLFGAFLAFYMLFFTLKDNEPISTWIGAHIGLPANWDTTSSRTRSSPCGSTSRARRCSPSHDRGHRARALGHRRAAGRRDQRGHLRAELHPVLRRDRLGGLRGPHRAGRRGVPSPSRRSIVVLWRRTSCSRSSRPGPSARR